MTTAMITRSAIIIGMKPNWFLFWRTINFIMLLLFNFANYLVPDSLNLLVELNRSGAGSVGYGDARIL